MALYISINLGLLDGILIYSTLILIFIEQDNHKLLNTLFLSENKYRTGKKTRTMVLI